MTQPFLEVTQNLALTIFFLTPLQKFPICVLISIYDGKNYSNIKANIVNNDNLVLSDHSLLFCYFHSNDICLPQQFKINHNNKLLTKEKLQKNFNNNLPLQDIFSQTDPNIIANTLIYELSKIIDNIAQSKKFSIKVLMYLG